MATDYNSTQIYTTPSDSPIHLYGASRSSPTHTGLATPMDQSPTYPGTSTVVPPHLSFATRQLRPPKSPMYVPAVLRPTERPHRPAPLTPPRSIHGSTDSLESGMTPKPPSRRSTGDGQDPGLPGPEPAAEPFWADDLPRIKGVPTRVHWKPDAQATICDAPMCPRSFSLFERRHHCRHCGHVFCNSHSHYTVPLDQDAEFHPAGAESRACRHCWDQYRRWKEFRASTPTSSHGSGTTGTMPHTPSPGIEVGQPVQSPVMGSPKSPLATSAPRDWSWSTF